MAEKLRTRLKDSVENNSISYEDAQHVEAFISDYATMNKLSAGSREKYLYAAQAILAIIRAQKKTLTTLEDADVLHVIREVQTSEWSEATKEDYTKRFKKIYAWLHKHKGVGSEQVAARFKEYVYHCDKNLEERKEILTEDEMLRVVNIEENLCYKVLWAVLYEGGLRIGEALALRLRDVTKNGAGYVLHLPKSKTIKRTIHLFGWSRDYISRWLNQHPQISDKDAMFFLNLRGEVVSYKSASNHLREAVKRAGIDKHISPHCLRHSRASHLANHLNEQQLCKFFGWSIGSSMPQTYIRVNSIDLEHALKGVYGIADAREEREAGVKCNWCGHRNATTAAHCDSCHKGMGVEEQVRGADESATMQRLVMRMIEEKYGSRIDALLLK